LGEELSASILVPYRVCTDNCGRLKCYRDSKSLLNTSFYLELYLQL